MDRSKVREAVEALTKLGVAQDPRKAFEASRLGNGKVLLGFRSRRAAFHLESLIDELGLIGRSFSVGRKEPEDVPALLEGNIRFIQECLARARTALS